MAQTMAVEINEQKRWQHVSKLLSRPGPFAAETFVPDTADDAKKRDFIRNECRILVIGAGGLGCELLKDLTLVGFRHIDVIDMDTIDVSNLNRQFLFRPSDVGKPKALVAADFINRRVAGANVVGHYCKIQDKDDDFYRQFKLVVCGLDSIEARRWINTKLVTLVKGSGDDIDPDTVIPLVDGGTEGFKGHVKVVLPRITACLECSLEMYPPQVRYPVCTIAHTPRIPEHCIEYANLIAWPRDKPFGVDEKGEVVSIDCDISDHVKWLYETAQKRAAEYNIHGVTYRLTLGVIKNIIPAIASTNAIIAAGCANEAFKIATDVSNVLNNWMMFNGVTGLYTHTFEFEKQDNCLVCSGLASVEIEVPHDITLEGFIELLAKTAKYQFRSPSIRNAKRLLWIPSPEMLRKQTEENLPKQLSTLIAEGDSLYVTDPALESRPIAFEIKFKN
eukprot:TRINITY_DN1222_c0_g1_i1.p1 TRINITY_DN1222_c0_g1~~TRINITY_DN1222_c0_g1_i1.p1  ORF type:complete len:447 (-),score=99.81 TRINITY_DN1222_c0_g1_i1:38-1378(-)